MCLVIWLAMIPILHNTTVIERIALLVLLVTFSERLNLNGQGEPWICRPLVRDVCGLAACELVTELKGGG